MSVSSCGRARRLLWPDGAPRAATPEVVDAQRHLDCCDDCRRFIEEMRSLAATITAAARRDVAPADVRERLFTALAHERAGLEAARVRRSSAVRWVVGSAAILVLAAGTVLLRGRGRDAPARDLTATLADDHVRSGNEPRLAASDPRLVTSWLTPQLSFAVHVPSLPNATLRGAHVALVDGRRAAVIEYDVRGTAVSYFVIPQPEEGGPAAAPIQLELTVRAGYRVVTWREPGLVHAMVGDLPPTQLRQLAHACIKEMGGVVALTPQPAPTVESRG